MTKPAGHPAAPEAIDLDNTNAAWPLQEILDEKDFYLVEDLAQRFASVPCGVWNESPSRARFFCQYPARRKTRLPE